MSRSTAVVERQRALSILGWLLREWAPVWLDLVPSFVGHATALRALPGWAAAGDAALDAAWAAAAHAAMAGEDARPAAEDVLRPVVAELQATRQ